MTDYETLWRDFKWQIPETFNFAVDVVDHWAEDADRLALIWTDGGGRERRFTYAEISRRTKQVAALLARHGVGKGDRVLIMLPRRPEWQIAMVGCLRLGAVPVPCITMLTAADVAYRIDHADAQAVVTSFDNINKISAERPFKARLSVGGAAQGWLDFDAAVAAETADFAAPEIAADDPAILYYTSGSTAKPKGVMHAARGLYTWRVSAEYWLTLGDGDIMWCTADTGWSKAGTSILFGPWSCGSTVLFYDGPFDAAKRLELLEQYRVTVFCAAATELRQLINEDFAGRDLAALRLTVSAGESVNPEIVNRWSALTGGLLLDGYGQTETLMTVMNYPSMPVKPGSMGRPLPGTEMAIIGDDDRIAGPGETGRLALRRPNPQMMLGYWQAPELTADAHLTIDGVEWFITGDTATIDADGYIFYAGRADDVINSAGYRIGPMEVENALMEHAAVRECAAAASPDAERGEVVKAFIILNSGFVGSEVLTKELQAFAKSVTAPYKYPRKIDYVEALPKTVTGKIQRRKLRDQEFKNGE